MTNSAKSTPVGNKKLKKGKRRSLTEDVLSSTSLPPSVVGTLRYFVKVTIKTITWLIPNPPDLTYVRLRWWGQTSPNGSVFRPANPKSSLKFKRQISAKFPVRCGEKQLIAYFNDMGTVLLDVLVGEQKKPVGRAQVNSISQLSLSCPIKGYFPVFSAEVQKIADLHVVMAIIGLENNGSSASATDASFDLGTITPSLNTSLGTPGPAFPIGHEARALHFSPGNVQEELSLSGHYHRLLMQSISDDPQSSGRNEKPVVNLNDLSKNSPRFLQDGHADTPRRRWEQQQLTVLDRGNNTIAGAPLDSSVKLTDSTDFARGNSGIEFEKSRYPFSSHNPARYPISSDNPATKTGISRDVPPSVSGPEPSSNSLLSMLIHKGERLREAMDIQPELKPSSLYQEALSKPTRTVSYQDQAIDSPDYTTRSFDPVIRRTYPIEPVDLLFGYNAEFGFDHLSEDDSSGHDPDLFHDLFFANCDSDVSVEKPRKGAVSVDKVDGKRRKTASSVDTELPLKYTGDVEPVNTTIDIDKLRIESVHDHFMLSSRSDVKTDGSLTPRTDGLSVERLTVLSKVSCVRLRVNTLMVKSHESVSDRRGRPPKVPSRKPISYIVEYNFPIMRPDGTVTSEVTRLCSRSVTKNRAVFDHLCPFPVEFSGPYLQVWWHNELPMTVYQKMSSSKNQVLLGTGSLSLREFLLSQNLKNAVDVALMPAKGSSVQGKLSLSMEMVSDVGNFTSLVDRMAEAEQEDNCRAVIRVDELEPENLKHSTKETELKANENLQAIVVPYEPIPLQVYLSIPEARITSERLSHALNTYLVCRLVLTNDDSRSTVCWASDSPRYNFLQVFPVLVDESLLSVTRNNFMVVEIWHKLTTAGEDQMVGLVKVPLHQFYLSYKDRRIVEAIMGSTYPAIATDSLLPIHNPFLNEEVGQLRVSLAMGSQEQVANLHQIKGEPPSNSIYHFARPIGGIVAISTEHSFEIIVEGVSGLDKLDDTLWGESDCFVSYHFLDDNCKLASFQTATTLCLPDPMFHSTVQHHLVYPKHKPIQVELTSSLVTGIPFELWTRYYYPKVQDKIIAKATLPITKLISMMTMKVPGRPASQHFTLPLSRIGSEAGRCGHVDINMKYDTSDVRCQVPPSQQVDSDSKATIVVTVMRACGLQTAALCVDDQDMQYAADVGLNAYAKVKMSFISEDEQRSTRTIARTFTPAFSHSFDYECPFVVSSGDYSTSLAEILETSDVQIEIWHQVPKWQPEYTTPVKSNPLADVLVATTAISLGGLLTKTAGVCGWFPLTTPLNRYEGSKAVSCLEVSIKFSKTSDRENVLDVGKHLGVSNDSGADAIWIMETPPLSMEFVVKVQKVRFPLSLATLFNQEFDPSTQVYSRLKFYDSVPMLGKPRSVVKDVIGEYDGDVLQCVMEDCHKFDIAPCEPLLWYLREEVLEVQVWARFSNCQPKRRDKLVGSAFVDLSLMSRSTSFCAEITGSYPLFRSDSPSIGGSILDVSVMMKPSTNTLDDFASVEQDRVVDRAELNGEPLVPIEDTFEVQIYIERAMHLPFDFDDSSPSRLLPPTTHVSFQSKVYDEVHQTEQVKQSANPIYDYQTDTRLPNAVTERNGSLVMKVWQLKHATNSKSLIERVVGFVSLDLSLLKLGFPHVTGWYNIIDFNGKASGQLKVTVTPLSPLKPTHCAFERLRPSYNQLASEFVHTPQDQFDLKTKSVLLDALSQNMADLDCLTNDLKRRLRNSPIGGASTPAIANTIEKVTTSSPLKECTSSANGVHTDLNNCVTFDANFDLYQPLNFQSELSSDPVAFANIMASKDSLPTHPLVDLSKLASTTSKTVSEIHEPRVRENVNEPWLNLPHSGLDFENPAYPITVLKGSNYEYNPTRDVDLVCEYSQAFSDESHLDSVGNNDTTHWDELDNDEFVIMPRALNDVSNMLAEALSTLDIEDDQKVMEETRDTVDGVHTPVMCLSTKSPTNDAEFHAEATAELELLRYRNIDGHFDEIDEDGTFSSVCSSHNSLLTETRLSGSKGDVTRAQAVDCLFHDGSSNEHMEGRLVCGSSDESAVESSLPELACEMVPSPVEEVRLSDHSVGGHTDEITDAKPESYIHNGESLHTQMRSDVRSGNYSVIFNERTGIYEKAAKPFQLDLNTVKDVVDGLMGPFVSDDNLIVENTLPSLGTFADEACSGEDTSLIIAEVRSGHNLGHSDTVNRIEDEAAMQDSDNVPIVTHETRNGCASNERENTDKKSLEQSNGAPSAPKYTLTVEIQEVISNVNADDGDVDCDTVQSLVDLTIAGNDGNRDDQFDGSSMPGSEARRGDVINHLQFRITRTLNGSPMQMKQNRPTSPVASPTSSTASSTYGLPTKEQSKRIASIFKSRR